MIKKSKAIKSPKEILLERASAFYEESNWRYSSAIEYDYDNYRACANGSDCCDNDYCRCGVIRNARVTNVDPVKMSAIVTEDLGDELLSYCADRIIANSGLMDSENWEVNVCQGYYGQEVDGVLPDRSIALKVEDLLKQLAEASSDFEKVKIALEAEYGYLLPNLTENEYRVSIVEVPASNIRLGNDDYMRKVSKEMLAFYADYKLPRGVCLSEVTWKNEKPYRLIDGYHRVTAALKNKISNIKIVLLERI